MKNILNMTKSLPRILMLVAFLGYSVSANAGGPLEVCSPDTPHLWPNGGNNVPYNPDQGGLGILDSANAVQAVTDAFQAWSDVPTATITYSNQGLLPVDVDVTNFAPFFQATGPDGLSAIVFDDTGEIFDTLFGAGSGILGFASPEFLDDATCTVIEGFSFLNGPAINSLEGLLDLMVHEFGHYSNLAHTEVNGQIYANGDATGPGTDNTTFGTAPSSASAGFDVIETMFPFLFGGFDQRARTPHADDIAILSRLYPESDFATSTGSISGTIRFGNNDVTGINVIARNLSNPFEDSVSAISSDFTRDYSQGSPGVGTYSIRGLTPGADYAVFVNGLLSGNGRFSTPVGSLPGPEEFYNGANESSNGNTDIPGDFTAISIAAGTSLNDVDILFNLPVAGEPLNTGDDGNVAIPLPFEYCIAGEAYSTVFINGNGFITFGAADDAFINFIESEAAFLSGPPRIAGFWDDLAPNIAGSVFYETGNGTFTVTWDAVPEFGITDGTSVNTFSIELRDNSFFCGSNQPSFPPFPGIFSPDVKITHGNMTSSDGLVGVSSGIAATSQFESEIDISAARETGFFGKIQLFTEAAKHELFSGADEFDLAGSQTKFIGVGKGFRDRFERNNSLEKASRISLPFDSKDTFQSYTALSPSGEDIDFYQLREPLLAGTTLVAEVLTGQIDSVLGLFRCRSLSANINESQTGYFNGHKKRCDSDDAELVASNDDSNGLLSRIVYEVPEDGIYVLAVSYFGDLDFDGEDPGQGPDLDGGRYVLDAFVVDGSLLTLTDDSAVEIDLDFDFNYQDTSYNSVFVNSNGFLSFGADAATQFSPSVSLFENGVPRIAPLWVDLNPSNGGTIVSSANNGNSKTISFADVPEFSFGGDGGQNTFSVTLNASGAISMDFGELSADSGITGLAEGGGATGSAIDISAAGSLSTSGTVYEQFISTSNPFDLGESVIDFQP